MESLRICDLTLAASSQIGILNGTADLAWTQAANDVRIPPSRSPSQHAQVLTITTS
jgi:hypothetical protein